MVDTGWDGECTVVVAGEAMGEYSLFIFYTLAMYVGRQHMRIFLLTICFCFHLVRLAVAGGYIIGGDDDDDDDSYVQISFPNKTHTHTHTNVSLTLFFFSVRVFFFNTHTHTCQN